LRCASTDDPTDDFRSKMEADVLARVFGLLQDPGWGARQLAIAAITAFAKFGRLIYHFVLCED
jgi:hypothetical protein